MLGLAPSRRKEWLLDIGYSKRETFAYSCEVYSRIASRSRSSIQRQALAVEYAATAIISDDRVDGDEVADIVKEAAGARNGWKIILNRCA